MENIKLETIGPRLINILINAWKEPFTTKSDLARYEADYVAQACELGLITCRDEENNFTNVWKLTALGTVALFKTKNMDHSVDEFSGLLRFIGAE